MDRPHSIASSGRHRAVKRLLGSYSVHIWPYFNFIPATMQVEVPPANTVHVRWHCRSTYRIHSPYMEEHEEESRDGAVDPITAK